MQLPFDAPTVEIALEIGQPCAPGTCRPANCWKWVPCQQTPPSQEFIYSKAELCGTMLAFGGLAAIGIPPSKYARFRLVARGLPRMCSLAEYVWSWDSTEGRYAPDGPPFLAWPGDNGVPDSVARVARMLGYTDDDHECAGCTG